MSVPLYVLRSPVHTLSRSLYFSEDSTHAVLGVEAAVDAGSGAAPGEVLRSGGALSFDVGQKLTYEQLLAVLMQSENVITL